MLDQDLRWGGMCEYSNSPEEAICHGNLTKGWPRGSTLGPCKEWQDTMSTSLGRCSSKALISGSLHDVWPPTMAPSLVATSL